MPEMPETPRPPAQAGPDSKSGEAMRAVLERTLSDGTSERMERTPPPPVPDHALLRCIGSGAYGEVWLARSALGAMRAVKVVYRAHFKEDRPYEREFNGILKYEPLSRTHEGLVDILHIGRHENEGWFHYVMELADQATADSNQCSVSPTPPTAHSPSGPPPCPVTLWNSRNRNGERSFS